MTADYVGRTKKDGIFKLFSCFKRFFLRHNGKRFRTRNRILIKERLKTFSVLCRVNAVRARTQNSNSVLIEIRAKLDCRLSAEGDDNAVRLFNVKYVLYVFGCQRLEIQSIRRVEVGGNRFGIVIDDDNFVAKFFKRPYAMYRRIVKFNTLTDTDRPRPDNHDTLFATLGCKRLCLVVRRGIERRIEIRRLCGKLACASVNHLKYRFLAIRNVLSAERFDILIQIPQAFPFVVKLSRKFFVC